MKKETLQKIILNFILFAILININLLVFASNANIEINSPEKVNYGENFEVSLKMPENTYAAEALVTVKYSDGTETSEKLVYMQGMADFKNLLTFSANVGGKAEIVFSNIILADKDSNVIETEKTKTKSIKIERSLTGLSLNCQKTNIDMSKTKTLQLNAILTPSDSTDLENVIWSSSDENVATVDKNGLVTAKNTGIVNITATCKGYKAVCDVNVTSSMTSLSLNRSSITLYYYKETNQKSLGILEPIIEPHNTTDSTVVSWSTSDSSVATVENGVVTPTGTGKATIVARCGNFTASCDVTVTDKIVNTTLTVNSVGNKFAIYSTPKTKVEKFLVEENFPIMLLNTVKLFDSQGNEKNTSDRVGSKDVVRITDSQNNTLAEYIIIVSGDINGDGQLKMYDAFTILKGKLFGETLNEIDTLIRDYNGDGKVKMYDAFSFLKQSLFSI